MAVKRGSSRFKITTLVVDRDIDVSVRLRHAIYSIKEFGRSQSVSYFSDAERYLEESDEIDVVFISYTFPVAETLRFIEAARGSKGGRNAAFVLVVQQAGKGKHEVAGDLLRGIDSALFEPFSCVDLMEVVEIAERVRRGRTAAREAIALKLLVPGVVRAFEILSFLQANGYNTHYTKAKLADVQRSISDFLPESLTLYFQLLTFRFEIAPLPEKRKHEKYEGASRAVKRRFERFLMRDLERAAARANLILG